MYVLFIIAIIFVRIPASEDIRRVYAVCVCVIVLRILTDEIFGCMHVYTFNGPRNQTTAVFLLRRAECCVYTPWPQHARTPTCVQGIIFYFFFPYSRNTRTHARTYVYRETLTRLLPPDRRFTGNCRREFDFLFLTDG